ncbi:MAG: hypothetical protein V4560_05900 [Bacteroidota bacterium]
MMCAKAYNLIKQRSVVLLTLTLGLILSPYICLAQTDPDNPCDGTDPFADCPIDTWVIALFAIALLLATLYLYSKQKESTR